MLKRIFYTVFLTTFCYLFSTQTVSAAAEFSTSFSTKYDFDNSGNATVEHLIELTNNFSHIYPTVYNLAISGGELSDIRVSVGDTSVAPQIDQSPSLTNLHIPINNPVVGKDQKTVITINYATDSFAEVIGNTYTLTLPKTSKGNEATSFVREVTVPTTYPELSFSSIPAQTAIDASGDTQSRLYRFVGSGDQSLTLHFGTEAHYAVELDYVLRNTTGAPAISEIALPPDTGYQQIRLNSITPEPLELVIDNDGNWLARYNLKALEKIDVKALLSITVSPTPTYFDPSTSQPTQADKYWEQSSSIRRLGSQLKNSRNLYDYLVANLTYDYSQIDAQKRLGADQALATPTSAICTEFTDLFVATSRAMGIPSRAIIGYAVTTNEALRPQGDNQDILHAYPEYYDYGHKGWRAVDPTWGHTTGGAEYFDRLDFGHITFVRWGSESSYPLPAGSYRSDTSIRQINVTISDQVPTTPNMEYEISSIEGQQYIVNTGTMAIVQATLSTQGRNVYVPYLPPYGRLPLSDQDKQSWFNYDSTRLQLVLPSILLLITAYLLWRKKHAK